MIKITILTSFSTLKIIFVVVKEEGERTQARPFEWKENLHLPPLIDVWVGAGMRFKEIIQCLIIEWENH